MRDIQEGEELTLCYGGDISNFTWFYQYGFVYQPNNFDQTTIYLDLKSDEENYDWKRLEITKHVQKFYVGFNLMGETIQFLGFCRFLALKKED